MAGEWLWAVGGAITVIVWALRSFVLKMVKASHAIFVSITIGVLGAMAAVFLNAAPDAAVLATVLKALGVGLTAGLAGGGLWSFLLKRFLPKPKQDHPVEPPKEEEEPEKEETEEASKK